jgi:hypothetical protein
MKCRAALGLALGLVVEVGRDDIGVAYTPSEVANAMTSGIKSAVMPLLLGSISNPEFKAAILFACRRPGPLFLCQRTLPFQEKIPATTNGVRGQAFQCERLANDDSPYHSRSRRTEFRLATVASEIRNTTSAWPTRVFRFHIRTGERPTDGPSVRSGLSPRTSAWSGFWMEGIQIFVRSSRNFTGLVGFQSPNHSSFHSYGRTKL